MLTLGVSAFYHDSSACLLRDGVVLAAVQEERFTRQKYDASLPLHAVQYCLETAGATIAEVDALAFYEIPAEKLKRQRWQADRRTGGLQPEITADTTESRLRYGLEWAGEIDFVDHHRAHAASAFRVSGFDEAAVLICDAVGEWDTTSFWHGHGTDLTRLGAVQFPHSLGLFYSCVTDFLGFRPNSDEYKVMGLASYGQPVYEHALRRLVSVEPQTGRFELDTEVLDFVRRADAYRHRLADVLGVPARNRGEPISDEHTAVAASVQVVLEQVIGELLGWLAASTPSENLCLAGGVALNCRANAMTFERSPFRHLFVQPAAGDAGTALGAALCAEADRGAATPRPLRMRTTQLGPEYDDAEIRTMLAQAGIPFTDYGVDQEALVDAVASEIADGRTVGWFQGRAEFGPRALGGRSILADPRPAEMKERLNRDIKWREEFRPFAPAVIAERAAEFFDMSRDSPFMVDLFLVRRPDELGAVTHVDGTARVQTVGRDQNPRYHRLIERFGELTGVPVLLNTSFNLSDEPIVCTPVDALRTFLRSSLDVLCLGPTVVRASALNDVLRTAAHENQRFVSRADSSADEVYSFF